MSAHSLYILSHLILDWSFDKNNTKHKPNMSISRHESISYAHLGHVMLMYGTSSCIDQEAFLSTRVLMIDNFGDISFLTEEILCNDTSVHCFQFEAIWSYTSWPRLPSILCLLALMVHSPQILDWSIHLQVSGDSNLLFLWGVNVNHCVEAKASPNDFLLKQMYNS